MANLGRCRGCNASIKWAHTEKGKAIPLDPDPRLDGNLELVPGSKNVVRFVRADSPPSDFRWVTHFATCPVRRQFTKGAAQRALRRAAESNRREIEAAPGLDQVNGEDLTGVAALEAVQRIHRAPGGGER